MRTIDIDHEDNQAIRREISERLRVELGIELEPPACLKGKVDELCGLLEGKSSSVVPEVEHGGSETSQARTQAEEKSCGSLGSGGRKADSILAFTEANNRR